MLPDYLETKVYRPIHQEVVGKQLDGVRITADTGIELDKIPSALWSPEGELNLGSWRLVSIDEANGDEHLVLIKGDISTEEPLLVRIHASNMPNEVFGFQYADDRDQLTQSMQIINQAGRGIIIYVNQEGAGNRLATTIAQLALTNAGIPMTQAFEELGMAKDNRSFRVAVATLQLLEVGAPIILMTNNKAKRQQLEDKGFTVVPYEFNLTPTNQVTANYLKSKKDAGIYE